MQVREIRALTGLRGIAALYVVAFHYLGGLSFSNPMTTLFAHGYLAVDLFLILSGFVMALNYAAAFTADFSFSTYLRFLWRRIARIYPLYIVMTLVSSLFFYFGIYKLAPFEKSLTTVVVLNAGMVQSWGLSSSLDAPAWSITAEWAAYLLFPAFSPFFVLSHVPGAFQSSLGGLMATTRFWTTPKHGWRYLFCDAFPSSRLESWPFACQPLRKDIADSAFRRLGSFLLLY